MASRQSVFVLPDGAKLAYELKGSHHLGLHEPIVLICGMTSVWVDYDRLTQSLIKSRPGFVSKPCNLTSCLTSALVLLYDHRGMGHSSLTPSGQEKITIELLARDLSSLLAHLKWSEVALCGYSMGGKSFIADQHPACLKVTRSIGVIAQQMLLLPYHDTKPITLPFRTTHLILAGTRSVVQVNAGLQIAPLPPNANRTLEEKRAIAQKVVSSLVDPRWVESNPERFDFIFKRAINPAM